MEVPTLPTEVNTSDELQIPPIPSPASSGLTASANGRRRVISYSVITYLAMGLGLVSGPLTVRALDATGRGAVAEVTVLSMLLSTVFTLGVESAIAHDAAHFPERRRQLLGAALRLTVFVTPFVWFADLGLVLGPLGALPFRQRALAAFILGLAPLGVLANLSQAFLVAAGSLGPLAWMRTLPIWMTGAGAIVLFAANSLTVVGYLVLSAGAVIVQLLFSLKAVGLKPIAGSRLAPLLAFGFRGSLGTIIALVNISLDQAIVGPFLGIAELGYYAVAVTLAGLPLTVAFALAFRSFGDVAGGGAGEDAAGLPRARARRAAAQIRLTTVVVLIFVVGMLAVSPVAVPLLYGSGFGHHVLPPLFLLGPGILGLGVSSTAIYALVALGRPGLGTLAQIAGLIVTGLGLPVALPRWGIQGAAAVSSVAYLCVCGCSLMAVRSQGASPLLPRFGDVSGALGLVGGTIGKIRRQLKQH